MKRTTILPLRGKGDKGAALIRAALLTHILPFLLLFVFLIFEYLQLIMGGGWLGDLVRTIAASAMLLYPFAALLCGIASFVCDILLLKEKRTLVRLFLPLLSAANIAAGLLLILRLGAALPV